jgi:hypothetical protein
MMWNNKELTEQIINQVRDKRVLQLEEAIDEALNYLEAIMGSDYYESETIKRIETLLHGE